MTSPVERVVIVGVTLRGRRHAAVGIRINGELRVRKRGGRSLCGVPVQSTTDLWASVDSGPETCKTCDNIATGRE